MDLAKIQFGFRRFPVEFGIFWLTRRPFADHVYHRNPIEGLRSSRDGMERRGVELGLVEICSKTVCRTLVQVLMSKFRGTSRRLARQAETPAGLENPWPEGCKFPCTSPSVGVFDLEPLKDYTVP